MSVLHRAYLHHIPKDCEICVYPPNATRRPEEGAIKWDENDPFLDTSTIKIGEPVDGDNIVFAFIFTDSFTGSETVKLLSMPYDQYKKTVKVISKHLKREMRLWKKQKKLL